MKKIMLAAVAASFMTTGAHAIQLPAEGEACSTIHSNISVGINNPELSDYRKCVMIQHDIDTAFTYKTFWVRSGTEFTSFPVETLAKMTRGERIDYIKLTIQQGIIIDTLEGELEKSKDMVLDLQIKLGKAFSQAKLDQAEIARLTEDLRIERNRIDEYTVTINTVDHIIKSNRTFVIDTEDGINQTHVDQARRDGKQEVTDRVKTAANSYGSQHGEYASVETVVDYLFKAGKAAGAANAVTSVGTLIDNNPDFSTADLANINKTLSDIAYADGYGGDVTELLSDYVGIDFSGSGLSANSSIADLLAVASFLGSDVPGLKVLKSDLIQQLQLKGVTTSSTADEIITAIFQQGLMNLTMKEAAMLEMVAAAPYKTFDHGAAEVRRDSLLDGKTTINTVLTNGWEQDVEDGLYVRSNRTYIVVDGKVVGGISAYSSKFQGIEGVIKAHVDGWAEGFEAGYSKGFNDGYDQGYADGYNKGFADGVASTQ